MSSADSFLNSAFDCFQLTIHCHAGYVKTPINSQSRINARSVVTLLVGIASMVCALSIDSVNWFLIYAYNFWATTVLVPWTKWRFWACYVSRKRFIAGAWQELVQHLSGMCSWINPGKDWGLGDLVFFCQPWCFTSVDKDQLQISETGGYLIIRIWWDKISWEYHKFHSFNGWWFCRY